MNDSPTATETFPLKDEFFNLRDMFVGLTIDWLTYSRLYESGWETQKICESTARMFFKDLYRILRAHIVLGVCKLTDRPSSCGRENLTIPGIYERLKSIGVVDEKSADFQRVYDAVMGFRKLVEIPRHRLIAHADKDAAVRDDGLGGYHPSEERQFFADLQDFSDQASVLIGVPPIRLSPGVPENGGVECLLKALGRGLGSEP